LPQVRQEATALFRVIVFSRIFVLDSVLLFGVILSVLFTEVLILIGVLSLVFKRFDPSRADLQAA
jgi:hypothetical protein